MTEDNSEDLQKISFLVADTYKCSKKYTESLRERLYGATLDQIGKSSTFTLDEGMPYQVVGEGDSGQEVVINISSINELSSEQVIKEAWFKILSTFHWRIKDD